MRAAAGDWEGTLVLRDDFTMEEPTPNVDRSYDEWKEDKVQPSVRVVS